MLRSTRTLRQFQLQCARILSHLTFTFVGVCVCVEYAATRPVRTYVGDICQPETIERAFVDDQGAAAVDCVFHCAAYVNFQFPPDLAELERVNVTGKLEGAAVVRV